MILSNKNSAALKNQYTALFVPNHHNEWALALLVHSVLVDFSWAGQQLQTAKLGWPYPQTHLVMAFSCQFP
jgi:hypothetical protein